MFALICKLAGTNLQKKLSEAVSEHPTFMTIGMCRGYGKIVSVLAFHSNDPSLNLAEFYSVYLDIVWKGPK